MRLMGDQGRQNAASSGRLRILVVTHFFPPLNSIASHRPFSWARTWMDMGHEVHVLTTEKYSFDGSMDLQYDLSGFRVHVVPYLRGKRNAQSGNVDKESVEKWEWLKKVSRRLRFGLGMFGDLRMLAYFKLVEAGRALLDAQHFDFVVSTYQPEVVHFVAYKLSRRFGVPWVADYRDLWFKDISGHAFKMTSFLAGRVEGYLLKHACLVSTVSEGLARQMEERFGREVYVCYNGYITPDNPSGSFQARKSGIKRIVYTGRVYKKLRDPSVLFRTLADLKKVIPDLGHSLAVDFYGYMDPWVRNLIRECGIEDCVHLHGVVSYQESLSAQKEADFLLFLDWLDQATEGVLTGKLFEYLGTGQPILSIGPSITTEAAQIIRRCGAGVVMVDETEVRKFLERWLTADEGAQLTPDATVVSTYSRDSQARALLKQIENRIALR